MADNEKINDERSLDIGESLENDIIKEKDNDSENEKDAEKDISEETKSEPDKKVCKECLNECDKDDLYCNKCGYKFEPNIIKDLICPECGEKYQEEDLFCRFCGANLNSRVVKVNSLSAQNAYPKSKINDANSQHNVSIENTNISEEAFILCPYCKSKIPKGSRKCSKCGEWVSGVSHFGCGSMIVIITIIFSLWAFLFGFSFDIPYVGNVTGVMSILLIGCAWLYFLPSLIADSRGHESQFSIFLVNLIFGWTVLGWILALILAFSGHRR
jgi:hypothetical protein